MRTPFNRSSGTEVQATAPGTRRLALLISGSVSHANRTAASQTTLDGPACANRGIAASPWEALFPDNDDDSKPRLVRLASQSLTAGRTAGRDDSLAVGEGSEIGPQGDAAEAGYVRTAIRPG